MNLFRSLMFFLDHQVRFALTSSPVFSKGDKVTDSERFYNSVLDLFNDPDEKAEVDEILTWWNQCENFILCISVLTSWLSDKYFRVHASYNR
jgi:Family of unknown function (DUF6698)